FEGLPFFYLRGAPPAGTVFYYDSIPLPALFHLGPGASVVHPRMLGDIQIVSGVPSARYGRLSGGLIVGDGPPPLTEGFVAEAEARLTDVSAYAHGRADDVEGSIAARYGFPGLIASAFVPSLDIQFADYQLRAQLRLDRARRLELVGLGSFDLFASNSYVGFQVLSYATTTLLFHRGELRYVESRGDMEAGIALRVGHDRGTNEDASTRLEVDAAGAGARAWMALRQGTFRLRIGTEHYANTGEIAGPPVAHPILGLAAGRRGRTTLAVYGELTWQPWPELEIAGGTRADVYIDPGALYASADPRLRVEWRPDRALSVHGAAGLTHQPSIYVLPLPALNELPARPGLQNVAQSEIGATIRARHADVEVTLDVRGYLHRFENMVVEDFIDTGILRFCDSSLSCRDFEGDVRLGWTSWGAELDGRASLGRHVSARLAYTLGFLDADPLLGFVEYTPSQDVQHILHAVLALDTGVGLTVGLRGFLRSGEVRGFNRLDPIRGPIRTEHRLPWWGRLDAMIAFAWDAGWARLRASLDWVNVLFALGGPPIDLVCDSTDTCTLRTGPAIPLPSLGLRGTFQ
ncbi:MAG: TonB-dependent receptor, partial [Sandaracinaceae bacterium]|nr:TonB-dependent receptor [Sandaracinaceae bacterium]